MKTDLADQAFYLPFGCMWQKRTEMLPEAVVGLLRGARTMAGFPSVERFGRSEQRPTPAVAVSALIGGIDEILDNNATGHLQMGDVAVEAAAHFGTIEATSCTKFTCNEATMGLKGR